MVQRAGSDRAVADFCKPERAAGMLAVPLPIHTLHDSWLLLVGSEKAEIRLWAGNPEKNIDRQSGRLSPRHSFGSWEESVRGRCAPRLPVQRRAAIDLAGDLTALIPAGEIGRLKQRLERLATSDHLTGLWNNGRGDRPGGVAGRALRSALRLGDVRYRAFQALQ